MSFASLNLGGEGWKQNYYRAKYHIRKDETDIHNIRMPDGFEVGAHKIDFDDSSWMPSVVPGDIRDALINAGEMPDPYIARNSDRCRWVENYEWWLRREVLIPEDWAGTNIELVFDGVDYLASYYWDGEHLGESADMFMQQRFDLTKKAAPGYHVLAVRISPPPKSTSNAYWDGTIPERAYHHKMQCSWGWDWVRELVSMGIWDDVRLESHKTARIHDVFIQSHPDDSGGADIDIEVTIINQAKKVVSCDVDIVDPDGTFVDKIRLTFPSQHSDYPAIRKARIHIDDAMLWWPNGYGEQNIYKTYLRLYDNEIVCDEMEEEFGIRKIEMRRNSGAPDEAYPLTFVINDRPIFICGINWVPADMLPGRVDAARYDQLLRLAKMAGFNLIRNWGGGLIEKKSFYRLCDRYGIMVWQEFPLSCSTYPETEKFLSEKREEAEFIVRKLRNHPSISMWCGGNEMLYYAMSPEHPVLKIFGDTVKKLHPGIAYHIACPDKSRPGERDHGPWKLYEPHSFWNTHFRSLTSEFGCSALPALEAIRRCIPENELDTLGTSLAHHFSNLDQYNILKSFDIKTLDETVFYCHLAQAELLQYVMGSKRSQSFEASGCIIWQFNSAWPEGGWSIVDYYGIPKIALYWQKKSTAPRAVVITDDGWELKLGVDLVLHIHAINGLGDPIDTDLVLEAIDSDGSVIYRDETQVHVDGDGSIEKWDVVIPEAQLTEGVTLVRVVMFSQGETIARCDRMFAVGTWRDAAKTIPAALLDVEIVGDKRLAVKNVGDTIALLVTVSDGDACFDNNFFNLFPGECRILESDKILKQPNAHNWTYLSQKEECVL